MTQTRPETSTEPSTETTTGPRIAVLQPDADCPPAHVGTWLAEAGAALVVCRLDAGEPLPDPASYDALLVLGGSMGANDNADHAWISPVRQLIRDAAADAVPLLGICLGHQLAAVALGGAAERNPLGQQFGLFDVGWTPEAHVDSLMAPVATPRRGVQWNDDVVTALPPSAVVLARATTGEVQVVRFAPTVWGVQLHPEVDEPILRPWAEHDRESHTAIGVDPDAVLAEIDAARAELDAAWRPLATRFAQLAAARSVDR